MDPIRTLTRLSIRTATTALVIAASATHAGETADRDCAPSAVHVEVDSRPLTREEKIARLDEALRESLARFDECQNAASGAAGGSSGMEGGHGGAASDGDGQSGRSVAAEGDGNAETAEPAHPDGAVASVAAEGVEGTERPEDSAGTTSGTEPPPGSGGASGDDSAHIPDDIPEPDNDSVLEAQIRRAAMVETDPKIRAELWNEYRKYKGLPTRPLPDDDGEHPDAQESE